MTTHDILTRCILHHLRLDGVAITEDQARNCAAQMATWMDQEIADRSQSEPAAAVAVTGSEPSETPPA